MAKNRLCVKSDEGTIYCMLFDIQMFYCHGARDRICRLPAETRMNTMGIDIGHHLPFSFITR